ncbi:uncharacterized protein VTP21DRAFT_9184 [Calcarisporiella thermophila]|uniref:uncharacterized protein n=1 Tax=Calcarisporiella thermophila TaxID=911321 RepID=UPI0037431CE7
MGKFYIERVEVWDGVQIQIYTGGLRVVYLGNGEPGHGGKMYRWSADRLDSWLKERVYTCRDFLGADGGMHSVGPLVDVFESTTGDGVEFSEVVARISGGLRENKLPKRTQFDGECADPDGVRRAIETTIEGDLMGKHGNVWFAWFGWMNMSRCDLMRGENREAAWAPYLLTGLDYTREKGR